MKLRKTLFTIVTLLFVTAMTAQNMPEAQKNLQRFDGKWKSNDIKLTIGDKTYTGTFWFNGTSVLDGTAIYGEEGFDSDELGSSRGLDMMSYDPSQGIIHWYVIDNHGTCHDHKGFWTDKDHFYAQYQGVVDGKMYLEKIYFEFVNDKKVDYHMTGELNGEVSKTMTGTFKK